jgi:hypothetical protein
MTKRRARSYEERAALISQFFRPASGALDHDVAIDTVYRNRHPVLVIFITI